MLCFATRNVQIQNATAAGAGPFIKRIHPHFLDHLMSDASCTHCSETAGKLLREARPDPRRLRRQPAAQIEFEIRDSKIGKLETRKLENNILIFEIFKT